jgi:hypothetical protein
MNIGDYINYQNLICQIVSEDKGEFYLLWFIDGNPNFGFCENIQIARLADSNEIDFFMNQRDIFLLKSIGDTKKLSEQNIRNILNENYDWRLIKNERKSALGEIPDDLSLHHLEAKRITEDFKKYCIFLESLVPYKGIGIPPLTSIQDVYYSV